MADALAKISQRRRWFQRARPATPSFAHAKIVAEFALLAEAMKAAFRWTMI
jgi:hypothetical protein